MRELMRMPTALRLTGVVIAVVLWTLSSPAAAATSVTPLPDTLRPALPKSVVGGGSLPPVDSRLSAQVICTPGAWSAQSVLANAVRAAGFLYDPRQDIIYSRMNPLQRKFGYAYGYDAAALAMSAVIDCEPIFFDYAGKSWMIELWKGQYGLETGCEIGVYTRSASGSAFPYSILDPSIGKRPNDSAASHDRFFDCASDDDLLVMSSTLYRKGQKLFCRGPERHWWLTGFKWGVYSEPADLTMDVSITCLDATMKSALVSALNGLGYADIQTAGNKVSFTFGTPRTYQPRSATPQLVAAARAANQQIVATYNGLKLANNDPNTVGEQAAAIVGRSFAIRSEAFFAGAIAGAAQDHGITPSSVLRVLTDKFDFSLDAASQFVANAGYSLGSWFSGLQNVVDAVLDFSCVVEIVNRGPYELVRESYTSEKGDYAIKPPSRIPAGTVGRFWLRDPKPSLDGSAGSATYSWVESSGTRRTSTFKFSDPTFGSNTASSTSTQFSLYTKSGNANADYGSRNAVVTSGHPLFVAFVWGTGGAP